MSFQRNLRGYYGQTGDVRDFDFLQVQPYKIDTILTFHTTNTI